MDIKKDPNMQGGAPQGEGMVSPKFRGASLSGQPTPPEQDPVDAILTDEEKKNVVDNKFADLKRKDEEFNENLKAQEEMSNERKVAILKDLFAKMEEMGVDPSNLDSINEFLMELEKSDPDLRILFEEALNQLTPTEGEEALNQLTPTEGEDMQEPVAEEGGEEEMDFPMVGRPGMGMPDIGAQAGIPETEAPVADEEENDLSTGRFSDLQQQMMR